MKFLLFSLIFSSLFFQNECAGRGSYTTTDENGDTQVNYVGLIAVAAVILLQLFFCFLCYKNTQRLRQEAQMLRAEIGAEYEAIKNAQFANMNQMSQFNYYLVYPNDPRFQANYQQNL